MKEERDVIGRIASVNNHIIMHTCTHVYINYGQVPAHCGVSVASECMSVSVVSIADFGLVQSRNCRDRCAPRGTCV